LAAVYSTAAVTLNSATAYQVENIWVSPQDVLQTPRMDGKTEPQF